MVAASRKVLGHRFRTNLLFGVLSGTFYVDPKHLLTYGICHYSYDHGM